MMVQGRGMSVLLITVLACFQVTNGFESICRKLQVSTDISVTKDDVVKDGIPVDKWNRNSPNPEIVSSSILLDYLYVTVEGTHKPLDPRAFTLQYDDHFFANSSLSMTNKESGHNGGKYTIEVKYKCKEYGGALIDYELDINIPECGQAHIFWKKICGNPLVPREGLSMDVEYKKYNQTIVKNGQLVDASYFDEDIDNFVFQVPASTSQTKFYLYMDLPKNKTDSQQKTEILKSITTGEDAEDEAEFQILEAILKLIPEVRISTPIIDADTSIVTPSIAGDLALGGTVTEVPSSLILTYNCLKKDQEETTIELSIPLDYFRDLNLIFVKKCARGSFFRARPSEDSGIISWIIYLFFVFEIVGTIFNLLIRRRRGLEAIPFFESTVSLLMNCSWFQKLTMRLGRNSRAERFPYKSTNEEEFESDFKIERMEDKTSKYGSI